MSYENFNENSALNQELEGKVPATNDVDKANESAKDEKPLNELQIALKDKFVAESTFVGGSQTRKADAETSLTKVRELESVAQKDKLSAEASYVGGAQTRKTDAETTVLEVRRLEALAEVKRLDVERTRLTADRERLEVERLRLMAETRFTDGARTYREEMDGRAAQSTAFMNYASVFGKVILIALQACLLAVFFYLFFVVFR